MNNHLESQNYRICQPWPCSIRYDTILQFSLHYLVLVQKVFAKEKAILLKLNFFSKTSNETFPKTQKEFSSRGKNSFLRQVNSASLSQSWIEKKKICLNFMGVFGKTLGQIKPNIMMKVTAVDGLPLPSCSWPLFAQHLSQCSALRVPFRNTILFQEIFDLGNYVEVPFVASLHFHART